MANEFDQLSPRQLANIGIYTPIEKRVETFEGDPDVIPDKKSTENQVNDCYIIPNQRILVVHPDIIKVLVPGRREKEKSKDHLNQETDQSKHDLVTSVTGLIRSLLDLLRAWFNWLFWFSKKYRQDRRKVPRCPKIDKNSSFTWTFEDNPQKLVRFRVVRISECPNDNSEYDAPSVNMLIDWDLELNISSRNLSIFDGLHAQFENILLINHETNSKPGHPPQAAGRIIKAYKSDFKKFTFAGVDLGYNQNDNNYYSHFLANQNKDKPIVAVVDTGLAYKWVHNDSGIRGRHYPSNVSEQEGTSFLIAKAHSNQCFPGKDFGYCGVTDYLQKPVLFNELEALSSLSLDEIMSSPYDDNMADMYDEGTGTTNEMVGRHGTIISAIINYPYPEKTEPVCQVLPVKVFNNGGMGTLFDVLSGCNYLLSRKRAGADIKVINASFSGSLNKLGRDLLYKKMCVITNIHKIWVVAAAGNQRRDLNEHPLYPASFGLPADKGGLERVITVTSAYGDGPIEGNTGDAVSIKARSEFPDGFLSVLPMEGGARLQGTSFAVPYVAAVLATAPDTVTTRADAIEYLKNNAIPGVVSFLDYP